MKLRTGVADAASEVKATAEKIGESAQWQTIALVTVTLVSVVALAVGCAALARSTS